MGESELLTSVIFIDHCDLRPVEVLRQVSHCHSKKPRSGEKVYGEFFGLTGLDVQPRLDVGYIEGVAQALDVTSEQGTLRTENCAYTGADLLAGWKDKNCKQISLLISIQW